MKIEDMDVFKLSHKITLQIYKITDSFPDSEKFGLISQLRRAASSVNMNLIEGAYRVGKNEYKHFVSIARGSCGEVSYQVKLSRDLGYIEADIAAELIEVCYRISMMLIKLYNSLK